MFRKLIATDKDTATTVLRLVLGIVFFAHGAQKMLGWFGGYGFSGTFGFFMNWAGTQKGEGYEFHLLALAALVFLMIRGAGAASVDRMLYSRANDGAKV